MLKGIVYEFFLLQHGIRAPLSAYVWGIFSYICLVSHPNLNKKTVLSPLGNPAVFFCQTRGFPSPPLDEFGYSRILFIHRK